MNQTLKHSRIFLLASMLLLTTFTFTASGCRLLKRDKRAVAEKKAEEADKKLDAEYEKARKQHYDHQTKEAKKMMKRTKKKSSKSNMPKKRKAFAPNTCS